MAEVIQFHCPACGITLRVPPAAAGFRGPCPRCQQEIIGPDPALGLEARRASPAPELSAQFATAPAGSLSRETRDSDPFNPFRHERTNAPEAVPAPVPAAESEPPRARDPEPAFASTSLVPQELEERLRRDAAATFAAPTERELPPARGPDAEVEAAPSPAPETRAEPFPEPQEAPQPMAEIEAAPPPPASIPAVAAALPATTEHVPVEQVKLLRIVMILSVAVAALAGLVAGYLIGLGNSQPAAAEKPGIPVTPAHPSQPASPPPEPEPPQSPPAETHEPPPRIAPPAAEPPPSPDQSRHEPPVEETPLTVIAAPEAALKAFLSAPDWKSRAKHVLGAERLLEKMESYHADMPDGPVTALSLKVDASPDDPEKGTRLVTYLVATRETPDGIPVAVAKTDGGWKVDWEAFVEFHDDHFRRFATGEGSDTGSFHVLVRNTHYFGEPFPGSDKLAAFRIDPPRPDRNQYVFVPTGSDLHKALAASTEWGRPCAPVLQLVRQPHGEGKFHLEIKSILAPNWRPQS